MVLTHVWAESAVRTCPPRWDKVMELEQTVFVAGAEQPVAIASGGQVALNGFDHSPILFHHDVGQCDHVRDVWGVRIDEEVAV